MRQVAPHAESESGGAEDTDGQDPRAGSAASTIRLQLTVWEQLL
ncbi:hypothetical protein [Arthrobacter pascens]|nr:hypothetical protein [Arthrobacter pascens]